MRRTKFAWLVPVLGLTAAGVAGANVCSGGSTYTLYADQDEPVGVVEVCNSGDTLKVTFNTTSSGWPMTQTHLAVGDELADIPEKNGNPIPGQFPYAAFHNPAVTEYSYYVPYTAVSGENVYIAAHAVVWDPDSEYAMQVCSNGTDVTYTAYNNAVLGADAGASNGRTGTAKPAAEPYGEQDDSRVSAWDYYVDPPFRVQTAPGYNGCADWIWEDNFKFSQTSTPCNPTTDGPTCLNEPVNLIRGDRVEFTQHFNIPGPPVASSMLYAAADNAYEAYINTTTPGAPLITGQTGATATYPDWWTSDLRQASASNYSVDTYNWESVESAALTGLKMGDNYLFFRAANEYMNTGDWASYGSQSPGNTAIGSIGGIYSFVTTAYFNPGAIIWQADVNYLTDTETAWGDGYDFSGKNWATYFIYSWAASP